MSYQIKSGHIISPHDTSYHTMSDHFIPYHVISYHIKSSHHMPYQNISSRLMSYHIKAHQIILDHIISHHVISILVWVHLSHPRRSANFFHEKNGSFWISRSGAGIHQNRAVVSSCLVRWDCHVTTLRWLWWLVVTEQTDNELQVHIFSLMILPFARLDILLANMGPVSLSG